MLRIGACGIKGCCDACCGRESPTAVAASVAAAEVAVQAVYEAAGSLTATEAAGDLEADLAECAALESLPSAVVSGAAEWSAVAAAHVAAGFGNAAAGPAVYEAAGTLRRRSMRWLAGMRVRSSAAEPCCGGRAAVAGASATSAAVLTRSLPQAGKDSRLLWMLALELLDVGRWGWAT